MPSASGGDICVVAAAMYTVVAQSGATTRCSLCRQHVQHKCRVDTQADIRRDEEKSVINLDIWT